MTKELRLDLLAVLEDAPDSISISGCEATGVLGFHSDDYVIGEPCKHCGSTISDQEIMDAYLSEFDSQAHFETSKGQSPLFLAILATAEYASYRWPVSITEEVR